MTQGLVFGKHGYAAAICKCGRSFFGTDAEAETAMKDMREHDCPYRTPTTPRLQSEIGNPHTDRTE